MEKFPRGGNRISGVLARLAQILAPALLPEIGSACMALRRAPTGGIASAMIRLTKSALIGMAACLLLATQCAPQPNSPEEPEASVVRTDSTIAALAALTDPAKLDALRGEPPDCPEARLRRAHDLAIGSFILRASTCILSP